MTKRIKLSPDAKQNAYEQRERAFTKRDFVVLKRRTDELGDISTTLETMIQSNAEQISLRATKTEVGALETRISEAEVKITADAILSTVQTKIGGTLLNQTQIEQRDSSVLTSAQTYTNGQLTSYATLTVLSNQIATRVATTDYNGNTIASLINQTATTIAISASKINLTGYVTLTNLSTAGQTTINGGNITTGTINANNVSVTNLNADNITAGTLNVNRIPNLNADKITTGVLNAGRIPTITADKISVTDLSALGATISSWTIGTNIYSQNGSNYTTLKSGGSVAFATGAPNPDNTTGASLMIYHNGYLYANNVNVSGTITATSGSFTGSIYSSSGTIGSASFSSITGGVYVNGQVRANQLYSAGSTANYLYGATYFYADAVTYNVRPASNNSYYLGTTNFRWTSIWQTSGSVTGSDASLKDDIIDIENGVDFILKLKPRQYRMKDGQRKHYGFIAQEVKEAIDLSGVQDVGIYIDPFINPTEEEQKEFEEYGTENAKKALRYEEFIAPMVQTIQHLNERIEILESRQPL